MREGDEMKNRHEPWELKQMQALPLSAKIQMIRRRIADWIDEYGEDGIYVSFSGGKDSTVLLDIVRKDYHEVKGVFADTGLELPSIRRFVKTYENIDWIKPDLNFKDVLIKHGYPLISKRVASYIATAKRTSDSMRAKWIRGEVKTKFVAGGKWAFLIDAPFKISGNCCDEMKKKPFHKYQKNTGRKPIIGTMASESLQREESWKKFGCNIFDRKEKMSRPISFWTENDVLQYIYENDLPIAEPYGEVVIKDNERLTEGVQTNLFDLFAGYNGCKFETTGCSRTGCSFCLFGIMQDKDRIANLGKMEPQLADFILRGGEWKDGLWQPSKDGLGYKVVIDWMNENGNMNIWY